MAVKPIPEGYHSVTPYLTVEGVPRLLEFVQTAFDAKEVSRVMGPDGRIAHAEVRIGDSLVRKMVVRTIAFVYQGLAPSDRPDSVLHSKLLGLEDLDAMGEDF